MLTGGRYSLKGKVKVLCCLLRLVSLVLFQTRDLGKDGWVGSDCSCGGLGQKILASHLRKQQRSGPLKSSSALSPSCYGNANLPADQVMLGLLSKLVSAPFAEASSLFANVPVSEKNLFCWCAVPAAWG